jgi:hypothetical protein
MGYSHSATGAKESHGRFIIIDGKEVYAVDASVKDLGLTQALITQIKDPTVVGQYINQFETWWTNASHIAGYNKIMAEENKTGLWLVRFALVAFRPDIEKPNFVLKVEGVEVRVLATFKPKNTESTTPY